MKLSTRARYGLRAMTAIARRPGAFTASCILADEEDISKKDLDSIRGRLREAGLLEAARGTRGGYRLARPARHITAADVVEAVDGRIAIAPCVPDASECARASRCVVHDVWAAASNAMREALAALTLAELAARVPATETGEPTYAI